MAAHLVIDNYPGFIAPMLPFIAAEISIPLAKAMLVISIANLTSYLSQPVFGFFADKLTKRFFIFWGILIGSIFIPAMGFARNFVELALIIVIGEIGVGFFHPQATGLVPVFSENENSAKKNIAWFLSLGTVGYGTGALISTKLYDLFGAHSLMFTAVFGTLFAFTMFPFVPKISSKKTEEKPKVSVLRCIKDIFSHKIIKILIEASILKSLIVSSFSMILPFYWKQIGCSASTIGTLSFVFLAASTAGMILSPYIEKKIGTKPLYYLSFLSVLPLALIFMFTQKYSPVPGYVCFALIGFAAFLTVPVNVTVSQKLLPEYKNLISGVVGGFSWGIIGVILPILGMFAQKFGILHALVAITCIPFLFGHRIKLLPEDLTAEIKE